MCPPRKGGSGIAAPNEGAIAAAGSLGVVWFPIILGFSRAPNKASGMAPRAMNRRPLPEPYAMCAAATGTPIRNPRNPTVIRPVAASNVQVRSRRPTRARSASRPATCDGPISIPRPTAAAASMPHMNNNETSSIDQAAATKLKRVPESTRSQKPLSRGISGASLSVCTPDLTTERCSFLWVRHRSNVTRT